MDLAALSNVSAGSTHQPDTTRSTTSTRDQTQVRELEESSKTSQKITNLKDHLMRRAIRSNTSPHRTPVFQTERMDKGWRKKHNKNTPTVGTQPCTGVRTKTQNCPTTPQLPEDIPIETIRAFIEVHPGGAGQSSFLALGHRPKLRRPCWTAEAPGRQMRRCCRRLGRRLRVWGLGRLAFAAGALRIVSWCPKTIGMYCLFS